MKRSLPMSPPSPWQRRWEMIQSPTDSKAVKGHAEGWRAIWPERGGCIRVPGEVSQNGHPAASDSRRLGRVRRAMPKAQRASDPLWTTRVSSNCNIAQRADCRGYDNCCKRGARVLGKAEWRWHGARVPSQSYFQLPVRAAQWIRRDNPIRPQPSCLDGSMCAARYCRTIQLTNNDQQVGRGPWRDRRSVWWRLWLGTKYEPL